MQFLVLLAVLGFAAAETKVASVGGNVSTSDTNLQPPAQSHVHCPPTYFARMWACRNGTMASCMGIVHGHRVSEDRRGRESGGLMPLK